MESDIGKETEQRLKSKLAAKLYGELDDLTRMDSDAQAQIERLEAERVAVRKQIEVLKKMIKEAGLLRTGSPGSDEPTSPQSAAVIPAVSDDGKTHKQMILEIILEAGEEGIRPVDVGNEIKRRYGKDITSGLHTQIARLSKEGKIRRMGEGWKTAQKNAG
ncbi:MAG: hypothetical protein WA980_04390 [Shinella zoogloeoides]|uniref:hypothetical protein n=1 Tax=Shinella zoogloeoides TaxID=352475 RepID=UPI003C726EBC